MTHLSVITHYLPIIFILFVFLVEACVDGINKALDSGDADELMAFLLKPESLLPRVDPSRPFLYYDNLKRARLDKGQVCELGYSAWFKFRFGLVVEHDFVCCIKYLFIIIIIMSVTYLA